MARKALRSPWDIDIRARAADLVAFDGPEKGSRAVALASEAQAAGDLVAESMATQALGMARRDGGDLRAGHEALLRAVALADRAGHEVQAVRARTSLVGLHIVSGDLRSAEALGRSTRQRATGADAARLDVQLALVVSRAGRPRAALELFDRAERALRAAADEVWLARLRANRAVVLGHLGRLAAAERDLERAARVLEGTAGAVVALNRAWLAALSADVPRALARYDDALDAARASGAPCGLVLRDRAELLSSVGLWAEACDVAATAVADLDRASPPYAAEARLVLADALLGAERGAEAASTAEDAVAMFSAQERPAWVARAQVARCRAGLGGPHPTGAADVLDAVEVLAGAGLLTEAQQARSLAARLAVASGAPVPAVLLPLAPVPGPPWVRAEAWLAEAERRQAAGDRGGARRAVSAGLRPLESLRRMLGSVELRAGVAGTARQLADLGVALAQERSGRELLLAAERRSAAMLPQGTIRVDERLAEALVTLRVTGQDLATADVDVDGDGSGSEAAAIRAVARAEARVRHLAQQADVTGGPTLADGTGVRSGRRFMTELLEAGEGWALVRFISCGRRLGAVVVEDGRILRHELPDSAEVAAAALRLRFGVARMAAGGGVGDRARRSVGATAAALDEGLFGRLRRRPGDRPLVVVPDGPLESVPWRALPSLAGVPLCVAPSAGSWVQARRRAAARGDAVFVAGPGLPEAEAEVLAAAATWPGSRARVLAGRSATSDSVRAALDGAAHAHFACHGRFRADNPLFSDLALADGPLTVVDLDLLQQAPTVVVLASCNAGISTSTSGAEALGLAAGFLAAGARTTLASVVPVADAAVSPLAVALTARIGAGSTPATALAEVTSPALTSDDPSVVAAAQGLCCFGAG